MRRTLGVAAIACALVTLTACNNGDKPKDGDGEPADTGVTDTARPDTGGEDPDTTAPDTGREDRDTAQPDTSMPPEDTGLDTGLDTGGDTSNDTGMVDTGPDCSVDSDGDGLDNCEEANLGTDPNDGDTDGDGLSDFEELQEQTDPLKADSDGGGATDKKELDVGLNPNDPSDDDLWRVDACQTQEPESVNYHTNQAGNWKIALPGAFSNNYTTLTLTNNHSSPKAAAVYEDPNNEVFGYLLSKSAKAGQNGPADALRNAILSDIRSATHKIIQPSTGGEFETHGFMKAARGEYLVDAGTRKSARKLRQELLLQMAPFPKKDVHSGLPSTAGKKYSQFRVFVSVIFRANTSGNDQSLISVAVAPDPSFGSRSKVRFRMNDLTNTTNISELKDAPLPNCATFQPGKGTPKVEFYWVLDQSGSMDSYNQTVANFGTNFVQKVGTTSLDYRLGVTNMDKKNDGRLCSPPGWTTSGAQFSNAIQNCVISCSGWNCDGGDEHGLESAKRGLSHMLGLNPQPPTPKEEIRTGANVVTIFMSDEEANSIDEDSQPLGPYKRFFKGRTTAFAITAGGDCPTENGKAYKDIASETGGKFASLCAKDLTQTIRDIIIAASGLASNYNFSQTPISSSLSVYLNGQWVPRSRQNGYDYFAERNSIAFFGDYRPEAKQQGLGDFVAVSYEYFIDRCKETGNGVNNCRNNNSP